MARSKKKTPHNSTLPLQGAGAAPTTIGRRAIDTFVSATISAVLTVIGSYFLFRPDVYAQFSCRPDSGTAPLVIHCVNESMYAKEIVWDFGDGTRTRGQDTISHQYGSARGEPFIVKLTAIGKGRDYVTREIHVQPPVVLGTAQRLSLHAVKASGVETTLKTCDISFTNDSHSSLLSESTRTYTAQCNADPGFKTTAARFVPVSQTRASVGEVIVSSDGTAATLSARITAGPQVDRYRGWLHGRLEVTQERPSPQSTFTLAKNLEVRTYGMYPLDKALPASSVDSVTMRIDNAETVSLKPGQIFTASRSGAAYSLLEQGGRLYLNVAPLPATGGRETSPAPLVQIPQGRYEPPRIVQPPLHEPHQEEVAPPALSPNPGHSTRVANASRGCSGLTPRLPQWSQSAALSPPVISDLVNRTPEDACESLALVLNSVLVQKGSGGRRLEEDVPLKVKSAGEDLKSAQQDSEIRVQFDFAETNFTDERIQLIYKAAILDAEGYYAGRDLLVQNTKQLLR
jgi:hypothetical protein